MEKEKKKKKRLTREQILALYQAGPEAVVSLTKHIPPKGVQLIRRYGLCSSRTKGDYPKCGSEMKVIIRNQQK
jgi:hypothetical protein